MQYIINLYHKCNQEVIMLIIMILSIIPVILLIKKVIFAPLKHYIAKLNQDYEKILKKYSVYRYLLHSLLGLYFSFWSNLFPSHLLTTYFAINIKDAIIIIYTGSSMIMLLLSVVDSIAEVYQNKVRSKTATLSTPITLYIQILKIIIIAISGIIIISKLFNISLSTFFTSIGAAAALLSFLFKDTVVGLLASLQLTSQDIIRIGDFISVKSYNIEGMVEKITISTVRVRNLDQTISTIPTSALLSTNVKNWREINELGARMIQRSFLIDMNSIMFWSMSDMENFRKSPHILKNILDNINIESEHEPITNLKLLRLYIQEYLKSNSSIYQKGFTFLVRQLAPTNYGLPMELYIYTKEMDTLKYENIQADIFDHILAIIPEFKLKIFQG